MSFPTDPGPVDTLLPHQSDMTRPARVGVLVSGRGSNLAALLDDTAAGDAPYRVVVVVSNRLNAPALDRGRAAGVPAVVVERPARGQLVEGLSPRASQHAAIARCLRDHAVDLVVCAGFDQILSPSVVTLFEERIINVHPSLLPAFGGTLHAQAEALAHGVKISGCTVHFVTADLDAGPIIAQAAVPVLDDDSVESLSARILEREHVLLPLAVRRLATHTMHVDGRRVTFVPSPSHRPCT